MKGKLLDKMTKDQGYEALHTKRDVGGAVQFQNAISLSQADVSNSITLGTSYDGKMVARKLIGEFTGMGTDSGIMTLSVNGTSVANTTTTETATLSPSKMENLLNPSFTLRFSPTTGTATSVAFTVQKEQELDMA